MSDRKKQHSQNSACPTPWVGIHSPPPSSHRCCYSRGAHALQYKESPRCCSIEIDPLSCFTTFESVPLLSQSVFWHRNPRLAAGFSESHSESLSLKWWECLRASYPQSATCSSQGNRYQLLLFLIVAPLRASRRSVNSTKSPWHRAWEVSLPRGDFRGFNSVYNLCSV